LRYLQETRVPYNIKLLKKQLNSYINAKDDLNSTRVEYKIKLSLFLVFQKGI
jgi:hypothetical protein